MGLKDSISRAVILVVEPEQKVTQVTFEQLSKAIVETVSEELDGLKRKREHKPKLVFVPSKNWRQTEADFVCESCGKRDILVEFGKLLLCRDSCAVKELEAHSAVTKAAPKDTTQDNGVWQSTIDNLRKLELETPNWAKGKETRYWEFFNRDYDIDKMSDETLRDSIIADGDSLFEIKCKQQKKIVALKERAASKSTEERKKLRLDDLTYRPEEPFENGGKSPIEEVRKHRTKTQQMADSLANLGLNVDVFLAKYKAGEKDKDKKDKKE